MRLHRDRAARPPCIEPSSVDLHIDRYFRVFRNHTMGYIDVKENVEDLTQLWRSTKTTSSSSTPGVRARFDARAGRSARRPRRPTRRGSRASVGSASSSTRRQGSSTPGGMGQLTLELSNVANLPITLYPGMKIGQISFICMTTPADHPYGSGQVGSKYQGQRGPVASQYYKNFL